MSEERSHDVSKANQTHTNRIFCSEHDATLLKGPTKGISGYDSWVFGLDADTKLVLSEDSKDVFLELNQPHSFVGGLFNGGGEAVPDLAVCSAALNDIVGDSGAAIITWRVPGQEAGLVCDIRDVKSSRRTRLICLRKSHLKFNQPECQNKHRQPVDDFLTEDVYINSGSSSATAVGGFDNVGGAVVPLGLADGDGGVPWLCVDGHPVIGFEDQIGLGPFHSGLRFTRHLGRELNLTASLGGQTRQQLGVQLDLWRLCRREQNDRTVKRLQFRG